MEEDNIVFLESFKGRKKNDLAFKDAIFELKETLKKLTETIESTMESGEDTEELIEASFQRNLKLRDFVDQWTKYLVDTERQTQIELGAIIKLAEETIEEMRKMTEDIVKEGESLLKDIEEATRDLISETSEEV